MSRRELLRDPALLGLPARDPMSLAVAAFARAGLHHRARSAAIPEPAV